MGIFARLYKEQFDVVFEKEDKDVSDNGEPEAEDDTMPPKDQTAK